MACDALRQDVGPVVGERVVLLLGDLGGLGHQLAERRLVLDQLEDLAANRVVAGDVVELDDLLADRIVIGRRGWAGQPEGHAQGRQGRRQCGETCNPCHRHQPFLCGVLGANAYFRPDPS